MDEKWKTDVKRNTPNRKDFELMDSTFNFSFLCEEKVNENEKDSS
jgi:hypothetical protein